MNSHDQPKNEAAELIRQKLESIYKEEPAAKAEAEAAAATPKSARSKHQQFMFDLTSSGKSLADIQTAWHRYYVDLPEAEKHEVWQEFYSQHEEHKKAQGGAGHHQPAETKAAGAGHYVHSQQTAKRPVNKTVSQLKHHINQTVNKRGQIKSKQHFQSLVFGLGLGSLVILILLFSFFNERIIAPFVTPSRAVSNTPIIIDGTTAAVDSSPKIVIPKINVEIPVDYTQTSIDEKAVDKALENGILHYPTTPKPGEKGNAVFFGHSSNNIFNTGKYKFAFVLLRKLETGDVFYVTNGGKRYAYRVYEKTVVKPTDVSVLGPKSKPATATLITCDPPGTSLNRLVVVGEQISPNPAGNVASSARTASTTPDELPSNAPTLWQRLRDWLSS